VCIAATYIRHDDDIHDHDHDHDHDDRGGRGAGESGRSWRRAWERSRRK
jgi:hypothetical protein